MGPNKRESAYGCGIGLKEAMSARSKLLMLRDLPHNEAFVIPFVLSPAMDCMGLSDDKFGVVTGVAGTFGGGNFESIAARTLDARRSSRDIIGGEDQIL